MKKVLILCFLLLAVGIPAFAQSREYDDKNIDSTLLHYYRWCTRNKQNPELPLKADTMFHMAANRHNRRMQAVALCLKTDYYYYTNQLDSLKAWVARTQQFTRRYDQLKHYYFIWTRLVLYYTKYQKYTLARYELEQFLAQAEKDDYRPGIAEAYKQLGHIFRAKGSGEQAIVFYNKAIETVEQNDLEDIDTSYLYLQLGEMYTQNKQYEAAEEALRKAENNIRLPEHIWKVRLAQASLFVHNGRIADARKLLAEIKSQNKGNISDDKIDELELSIRRNSGDYTGALAIAERQLSDFTQGNMPETHYFFRTALLARASILYKLGNYRASADDFSRFVSLQEKKIEDDNRETLGEFATLLDVSRLDHEKAELEKEAQNERLRRTRAYVIALAVVLVLCAGFIFALTRMNRHLSRAKRAAEESNRMKGIFIRNITHEINTPLNAIVGFAALASTTETDSAERREYIDIIRENSGDLQKLIDDVLYIADIESAEASGVPVGTAPVEINACCREALQRIGQSTPNETELQFLPGSESLTVTTSGSLLTKALLELLRNALRFAPGTPVTLAYTVEQGIVAFTVTDAGAGIPASEAERIFERFVKLDTFTQGQGLGLSVARLIARTLGGDLHLDTSCTTGARFVLTLPLR